VRSAPTNAVRDKPAFRAARAAAFACGLLILARPAPARAAATPLCVNPAASSCYATIQAAVNAASTKATINVAAGTYNENLSINLAPAGSKPRKFSLTIAADGSGPVLINGQGGSVITVGAKTTLSVSGTTAGNSLITIAGGNAASGGGISADDATIVLTDCIITSNQADEGAGIYLDNGKSLTIVDSTIDSNTASGPDELGGGIYFAGAGTADKVSITNSTISGNMANEGAGAYLLAPDATLTASTISGNTATDLVTAGGDSGGDGAGVYLDGGKLTVLDSTISGNVATNGSSSDALGGGLENHLGKMVLNNATIAANSAGSGGGIETSTGQKFTTSNSIIADNSATITGNDCAGAIESKGYNLILDESGCTLTVSAALAATDLTGAANDPQLEELALNAPGTTATMALPLTSVAVGAGNPKKPTGSNYTCLPTDQRGIPRWKGNCDIGAFEPQNFSASVVGGVYALNPITGRKRRLDAGVRANSNVVGILEAYNWKDIETADGVYDWTMIDRDIKTAAAAGKRMTMSVQAGVYTPSWVYRKGAQAFQITWDKQWGFAACSQQQLPVPWDPVFQQAWAGFVAAFGARYGANPTVASVKLTGFNGETPELALPLSQGIPITVGATLCNTAPNYVTEWQSIPPPDGPYTRTLAETAWETIAAEFAAAFPAKPFSAEMEPVDFPPIDANGNVIPGAVEDDTANTDVINWAIANYNQQFVLQNDGLSYDWVWPLEGRYTSQINTGYQMVSSTMGSSSLTGLTPAVDLALTAAPKFLEIGTPDIDNPALASTIALAASQLP